MRKTLNKTPDESTDGEGHLGLLERLVQALPTDQLAAVLRAEAQDVAQRNDEEICAYFAAMKIGLKPTGQNGDAMFTEQCSVLSSIADALLRACITDDGVMRARPKACSKLVERLVALWNPGHCTTQAWSIAAHSALMRLWVAPHCRSSYCQGPIQAELKAHLRSSESAFGKNPMKIASNLCHWISLEGMLPELRTILSVSWAKLVAPTRLDLFRVMKSLHMLPGTIDREEAAALAKHLRDIRMQKKELGDVLARWTACAHITIVSVMISDHEVSVSINEGPESCIRGLLAGNSDDRKVLLTALQDWFQHPPTRRFVMHSNSMQDDIIVLEKKIRIATECALK